MKAGPTWRGESLPILLFKHVQVPHIVVRHLSIQIFHPGKCCWDISHVSLDQNDSVFGAVAGSLSTKPISALGMNRGTTTYFFRSIHFWRHWIHLGFYQRPLRRLGQQMIFHHCYNTQVRHVHLQLRFSTNQRGCVSIATATSLRPNVSRNIILNR